MEQVVPMENKKKVWQRLREWIWSRKVYFLVFALPALIMYIAYAFFGVHPYGDNSVLVLDLNGQYVYYYEAFRDFIHGGEDLYYNWSRNLSGEMFGIFAYYLASPFMLIICLLPRSTMCGAIELLQILKIGTAAVTFAVFLRKTSKPKSLSLVVFGSCYALMSYMVVQLMDPMWLDGLIYLPLICLGVHRLVDKGKVLPFAIPLALMFMAHFYIGYMVGIFTFMYFMYYCFSQKNGVFPPHFLRAVLKFALGTLTALMCAAIVLITVYNSLKLGKFEFTEPDFSMATQFDFASVLTKLFPMTYDSVNVDGMPMIYCGTITVLLIPLFFMNKNVFIKKKVGLGLIATLLLVCMYIRPVDMVWHGFQMPNWLPFRYSFAFSFILLLMAYEAFENLDGVTSKEIGGAFFGILVYLLWCERENYAHFQIFDSSIEDNGEVSAYIQGIWFSALALVVCFLLVYLCKKYKSSRVLCVVTTMLVGLELVLNTMDTLAKIDNEVCYSTYSSYEPYMSNTIDAVEQMKQEDTQPFYRMEATFHRTVNDPIGTGYYGLSHSSSTMNSPALTMLKQLGFAYAGHSTKYEGATYITDALFDVKYLMDKVDEDGGNDYSNRYPEIENKGNDEDYNTTALIPEGYEKAKEVQEDGTVYTFYENPYALGLGVVCDQHINSILLNDSNPFENQNIIYNTLASVTDEYTEYFTRIEPYGEDSENLSTALLTDGHTKYYATDDTWGECHIDYLVKMDKESYLYMYLPTSYERSCNVWVQNEDEYIEGYEEMSFAGQFFEGDNYAVMNLGKYNAGDKIRVRITIANDDNEAYWLDTLFYSFDKDQFEAATAQLQKGSWNVTEHEGNYVEGTVTSDQENQVLFTTIPYENGWTVKVNGKKVETGVALGSLMTIPLEQGENVITMEFSPGYLKLAVIISIFGLLILVCIFVFEYKDGRIIKRIAEKPVKEIEVYHESSDTADTNEQNEKDE